MVPKSSYFKFFGIALFVIALDQLTKMLVHFNMEYGLAGQIKLLGDWFKLHYTLNPGMAFGIEIGGNYGKLWLTLFRMAAMAGISYYLYTIIKNNLHPGYIVCVALILGGAIGNLIDSIFYGVLLNNAPVDAPTPWFHGQVVDMIFIDIWEGMLPEWLPIVGGQWYSFWPIFNIADASIFCGVFTIILFQNKFFKNYGSKEGQDPNQQNSTPNSNPS
jgi:signal peptidase II